jgi:hypothetical protein
MNTNKPNPDSLESRLSRQPIRAVPAAWRKDILAEAGLELRPRATSRELRAPAGWRQWLWPNPLAWGGVAAAWITILALQVGGRWEPVSAGAITPRHDAGLRVALIEHRRQLNELLGTPAVPPAPVPAPAEPAPRGALTHTNRLA